MDPLTQMSIGAAAAVSIARHPKEIRHALVLGALAGGAPDLDVFIRSESDPLVALVYHRHFTHALLLAPIIGLLVAALYRPIAARKLPWKRAFHFGILATLTHGLLDACTSYGTLLYWPISSYRESWDMISIIDPVFTLPLLIALVLTWIKRSNRPTRFGLVLAMLYLGFGVYQREQAQAFARELAESRGHYAEELTARPSLGNLLLWRVLYRDEQQYYVDAVWTFPGLEQRHYAGGSVQAFSEIEAYSRVDPDSVLWNDIERFRHFSQGYLYLYDHDPLVAGDLRYAAHPDSLVPLWGITIEPGRSAAHTKLLHFRKINSAALDRLWTMIRGQPILPELQ